MAFTPSPAAATPASVASVDTASALRKAALRLEIDVTVRCKQMLRDARMLIVGRGNEWRAPIICLKINFAATCNKLCCD